MPHFFRETFSFHPRLESSTYMLNYFVICTKVWLTWPTDVPHALCLVQKGMLLLDIKFLLFWSLQKVFYLLYHEIRGPKGDEGARCPRGGSGAERQSRGLPLRGGDPSFWKLPMEVWRPWGRVANIWQNNLLEASWREPHRAFWCLLKLFHTGSRSGTWDMSTLNSECPVP